MCRIMPEARHSQTRLRRHHQPSLGATSGGARRHEKMNAASRERALPGGVSQDCNECNPHAGQNRGRHGWCVPSNVFAKAQVRHSRDVYSDAGSEQLGAEVSFDAPPSPSEIRVALR